MICPYALDPSASYAHALTRWIFTDPRVAKDPRTRRPAPTGGVDAMRPYIERIMADLLDSIASDPKDQIFSVPVEARPEVLKAWLDEASVGSKHDSAGDGDNPATKLFTLLGAGSVAVTNLITKAVTLLLTHPDQLELVRLGHASWDDVVDETVRLEPACTHPAPPGAPGAPLARLQASIALSALFQRFPRLRLAAPDEQPGPDTLDKRNPKGAPGSAP